jgi:hypothetical protein
VHRLIVDGVVLYKSPLVAIFGCCVGAQLFPFPHHFTRFRQSLCAKHFFLKSIFFRARAPTMAQSGLFYSISVSNNRLYFNTTFIFRNSISVFKERIPLNWKLPIEK